MRDGVGLSGVAPTRTHCPSRADLTLRYSPVGRGFLTGAYSSIEDLAEDDFRRYQPRFQGDKANLRLVERVREIAAEVGCSPVQLAPAWLLHQGEDGDRRAVGRSVRKLTPGGLARAKLRGIPHVRVRDAPPNEGEHG